MVEAIDRLSTWFFVLEFGFLLLTIGIGFNLVGEVQNKGGTNDGGGAQVTAKVQFLGEIGMRMHGGGAPSLILSCGRSLHGLKFKFEIKSEFSLKHKIPQNLEIKFGFE
jgi:hypothetical protein